MLWTDKIFVTSEDLEKEDGDACVLASDHSVPVDGLNGAAHRGMESVALEIRKMAANLGYSSGFGSDFSYGHLSAVMDVGGPAATVSKSFAMPQVVVDEATGKGQSAIKRWCIAEALFFVYKSQSSRMVEDRFKGKRDSYMVESQNAKERIYSVGIPLVYSPLHRPAAELIDGSGIFDGSSISVVSGPGALGGSFDVAVSYVGALGEESALSEPVSKVTAADEVMLVDVSSLSHPTGAVDPFWTADGLQNQISAVGWNVYARSTLTKGQFYKQNSSLIDIGDETYAFASDPVLSGTRGVLGQAPTSLFMPQRLRMRF